MPHFVIECNEDLVNAKSSEKIMQCVHEVALKSGLFDLANIKVGSKTYEQYFVAGEKEDFIHVFANVMEGRTIAQRSALSKNIVSQLKLMFPEVPVISVNVWEFEKDTYANLKTINGNIGTEKKG